MVNIAFAGISEKRPLMVNRALYLVILGVMPFVKFGKV